MCLLVLCFYFLLTFFLRTIKIEQLKYLAQKPNHINLLLIHLQLILSNFLSPDDSLLLIWSKANHPNIVKLLGNITLKDQKWVIPLEFIFGEDLETTIFKSAKSKIKVSRVNRWLIVYLFCFHCVFSEMVKESLTLSQSITFSTTV